MKEKEPTRWSTLRDALGLAALFVMLNISIFLTLALDTWK